jgi:hypothetical protein
MVEYSSNATLIEMQCISEKLRVKERDSRKWHLDSKITKSKDAFTISYNNDLHILFWPVLQYIQRLTPMKYNNAVSRGFIRMEALRLRPLTHA